ncbi:MAG: helix-turn-helix domain-containing protein [Kiritimatiellae bacterium]|nr:helix-turn-helix domain-containing protein [Kiritimatiellia bacterium]MDD5520737.1 helix-turn-helix domain-containing protein [Kiritimatiellia bacterium]
METITTDTLLKAILDAPVERRKAALAALTGKVEEHGEDAVEGTLTISQAATRAKTSRPTIYRALAAGVLVALPLYPGGRPKIREEVFREWLHGRQGVA